MSLRTNPGPERRRQSAPSSSSWAQSPPKKRRTSEGDYYDDSDEENGKGHAPQDQMYSGACSLGRFCLNPCLCLATSVRMFSCRPRQEGPSRARRRSATPPDVPFQKLFLIRGTVIMLLIISTVFIFWPRPRHPHSHLRHDSDVSLESTPILIKLFDFSNVNDVGGWHYHGSRQEFHSTSALEPLDRPKTVDYGGLLISSMRHASPESFRRTIASDDDVSYQQYKKKLILQMDQEYRGPDYDHVEETLFPECRRANFEALYFPTCNNGFHDVDLSRDYDPHVLGAVDLSYFDSYVFAHGYYRDAWMLKRPDTAIDKGGVLKTLRLKHNFDIEAFGGIQKDALVMERLTSSPRILNMYGHCSMSMLAEPMQYEVEQYIVPGSGYKKQAELDKLGNLTSMNSFSVSEKLEMALAMAESIADLHGYQGGVIVHDDVQPCQWLRNSDNKIIFGDFNRAEVMKWSDKEGYCKYKNGYVYGNVSILHVIDVVFNLCVACRCLTSPSVLVSIDHLKKCETTFWMRRSMSFPSVTISMHS